MRRGSGWIVLAAALFALALGLGLFPRPPAPKHHQGPTACYLVPSLTPNGREVIPIQGAPPADATSVPC